AATPPELMGLTATPGQDTILPHALTARTLHDPYWCLEYGYRSELSP
ncbi:hypothetical protein Tco_1550022, partial [Tanacetum coccineum]